MARQSYPVSVRNYAMLGIGNTAQVCQSWCVLLSNIKHCQPVQDSGTKLVACCNCILAMPSTAEMPGSTYMYGPINMYVYMTVITCLADSLRQCCSDLTFMDMVQHCTMLCASRTFKPARGMGHQPPVFAMISVLCPDSETQLQDIQETNMHQSTWLVILDISACRAKHDMTSS